MELLENPNYWIDSSLRLKLSSEILRDKIVLKKSREKIESIGIRKYQFQQLAIFQSHMMLMGFAIENLLKGYSIYFAQKEFKMDIKSFIQLKTAVWKVKDAHDVIKIAIKAKLNLSEIDREIILRYAEFTKWAGRYHVPVDLDTNKKLSFKPSDLNFINKLFDKIISTIKNNYEA